jgi:GST-like protein
MIVLYGAKGSGSAAVEAALEIAGVPYRIVNAASWEPDSDIEALRRVNPLLQIPTVQLADGSVLTESAAILIHLGLTLPVSGLLSADSAPRAQQIRGLVFIAANCYAAVGIADYPERWTTDASDAATEHVRAGARARLHRYWEMFDDQFRGRPYLSGAAPGALDLLASVVSKWSGTRQHLRTARPGFLETLERIEQIPAIAAVYARHWPSKA